VTPQWRAFLAYEIERNRALYSFADTGIALLPPRSARCVGTARVLHSQILDQIEQNDYDVFSRQPWVPTKCKAATAARIMVTGPRTLKRQAEAYQRFGTSDTRRLPGQRGQSPARPSPAQRWSLLRRRCS
jgi:15-cis-phytoene synthase